jgi:hypothetical protein
MRRLGHTENHRGYTCIEERPGMNIVRRQKSESPREDALEKLNLLASHLGILDYWTVRKQIFVV